MTIISTIAIIPNYIYMQINGQSYLRKSPENIVLLYRGLSVQLASLVERSIHLQDKTSVFPQ